MQVFWQAELTQSGESYDRDFPRRTSKEEAMEDARTALASRFTPDERNRKLLAAWAGEWQDDGSGLITNTGRGDAVTVD